MRKLTSLWDDKFQPRTSQQHHSRTQKLPSNLPRLYLIFSFPSFKIMKKSTHPSIHLSSSFSTWISNLPCGVLGVPSGVAFQTKIQQRGRHPGDVFSGQTQVEPFLPGNVEVKKQVPPIAVPFQIHSNTASFHSHDYGRKSNPRNGSFFFVGRFAMRKPSDSNTGHCRLILIADRMEG